MHKTVRFFHCFKFKVRAKDVPDFFLQEICKQGGYNYTMSREACRKTLQPKNFNPGEKITFYHVVCKGGGNTLPLFYKKISVVYIVQNRTLE